MKLIKVILIFILIFASTITTSQLTRYMNISGFKMVIFFGISCYLCYLIIYIYIPKYLQVNIFIDRTNDGIYDTLDELLIDNSKKNKNYSSNKKIYVSLFFGLILTTLFFTLNTVLSTNEIESWECYIENPKKGTRYSKNGQSSKTIYFDVECNNGKDFEFAYGYQGYYNWNLGSINDTLLKNKLPNELNIDDKFKIINDSEFLEVMIERGFFAFYTLKELKFHHSYY